MIFPNIRATIGTLYIYSHWMNVTYRCQHSFSIASTASYNFCWH
ncbi:hypothetical protein [Azospirillum palustre]